MKKRITPILVAQALSLVLVPTFVFGFQPEQQKNFTRGMWEKLERGIGQRIFQQTGLNVSFSSPCPGGNLGGWVWQDFDFDGVRDTYETIGVENVTVQVYDCDGNLAATDVSATDGNWDIDPTGISFPVRVEFSDLPAWAGPTFNGTNSETTVQYVSAATCAVDLGVANAADYCNTTNPATILSCYESGNAVYGGSGNTDAGIISFPYNSTGATPTGISAVAQIYQVGTVWGMGWQPKNKRMFTSAFLKRHSGFGPQGIGGVYVLDFTSGTGSVSTSFTLQGVSPANGGSAIDLGSVTRTGTDYALPNSNSTDSWDLDAFDKIGKISYGDADISEDGNTLWLVNLYQRALVTVDVSSAGSYPGEVNQYLLSNATGLPTCTNGVLRPWALGFNKGKGYLGCACTAESGGTAADLHAYVLSFDPEDPTIFTTEMDFDLDYTREKAVNFPTYGIDIAGAWKPWISTWAGTGYSNSPPSETGYPQPALSDIDFADDGSMILGVLDRFGYQMGYANYIPVSGDNSQTSGDAAGDIIKVCRANGAWVLEGGAGCADSDSTTKSTLDNDGPSNGGEFYYSDYFDDTAVAPAHNHNETFIGSLGILKGTNEILATHYDPVDGNNFAFDQGVLWHNTRTGARADNFMIVASGPSASKGNNLGDFAYVCANPPIQIGNYLWVDDDRDGVQGPCETGLNGVTVKLYKMDGGTTTLMATTSTSTLNGLAGSYFFKDYEQYGTGYDTLTPGKMYFVVIGEGGQFSTADYFLNIGGTEYELTSQNDGEGTNPDLNDSDAYLLEDASKTFDGYPVDTVTIGQYGYVNHTLDFGFKLVLPPFIGEDQEVCAGNGLNFVAHPDSILLADSIAGDWIVKVQPGSTAMPSSASGVSYFLTVFTNSTNNSVLVDTVIFTLPSGYSDTALVTVYPASEATISSTHCEGDGYSEMVGGTLYDESNPAGTEILANQHGCDSTIIVNLVFDENTAASVTYDGCEGDGYSVTVNGTVYDESNQFGTEVLTNQFGCDSTVTVSLTFHQSNDGLESYNGCVGDGYSVTVNGTVYDESNPEGTEILTNQLGCDSIVTVNLAFEPSTSSSITYTGCIGDGYFVNVNGTVYDEVNTNGVELMTNQAGCDSTVTIDLEFGETSSDFETYTGCEGDGYSVTVGGTVYDESNPTGTEVMSNQYGCDSTIIVNLVFDATSTTSVTYEACEGDGYSVTVGGTVYDESNPTGTEVLSNQIGCDSTVTVSLVFNPTSSGTETYMGCHNDGYSVVVNGTVYDESNPSGTEILTNQYGCDSTVTVNLVFNTLNLSADVTGPTSIGGSDGSIDLTVSGGASPYTYDWDIDGTGDNDDTQDLSGLEAGTYEVVVNDADGCSETATYIVNDPQTFDLALRKTLAAGQSDTVLHGETVTFTVTIFNQGTVGATNVLVIDYLPLNMTFSAAQNPGWINFGAGPTWFLASLAPGASVSKDIKLVVSNSAPEGTILNYVEISAADDNDPDTSDPPTDLDSSPDAFLFDDPGGQPGGPADDIITGDGTGAPGSSNPATDEDDHDGASVFLFVPTLSLGNLVFYDYENDGIFNNDDSGAEDVEVELYDAGPDEIKGTNDDQFVDNQSTNAFGEYLFTGLSEGFYFVKLNGAGIPTGHVSSTGDGIYDMDDAGSYEPATGTDNDVDNEDDGTQMGPMVMSEVLELSFGDEPDGDVNLTVDFGLYEPQVQQFLSLGNLVFYDYDNDGVFNNDDVGAEDVEVELYDAGPDEIKGTNDDQFIDNQSTNGFGEYLFTGLSEGFYFVKLNGAGIPTGHVSSTGDGPYDADGAGSYEPASGTDSNVDDSDDGTQMGAMVMSEVLELSFGDEPDGNVNLTVDFGLYEPQAEPASLGNYVWYDDDLDGQQDGNETGAEDVEVQLFDLGNDGVKGGGDDNLLDTDVTDADGAYGFTELAPGSYYVVFVLATLPTDYLPTAQDAGGDEALDSDANGMGMTDVVTLGPGDDNPDLDLGIYEPIFDLALLKYLSSGQPAQVDLGDEISYTIKIINQGVNTAWNVNVLDHIPAGLSFSPNNTGWTLLDPQTAETTLAGPILPGDADSVEILLVVQYGASGQSLLNTAEIESVEDSNGNEVDDVDSTPDNGEPDEDDLDEVPVELVPHDPTGWVYCDKTGKIITGGTISVTGPNGIPNDQVTLLFDGSDGYYEFFTDGTPGVYTISYSHPDGYPLSASCPPQTGPFDPTGLPSPVVFGADTLNSMMISDADCASNPFYLSFEIETGDPNINLNNLPISCTFIGAFVCDDANLNDAIDTLDLPVAGATVYLYACNDLTTPIDSVVSDVNGRYGFGGLLPGDYVVGYDLAAGYRPVSAGPINPNGFSDCISLAWGQCDTTKTICLYPCPTLDAGPDIIHCSTTSSSQLNAGLSHGTGDFSWIPPTGLSDPNIADPVASPPATTNYIVLFDDNFGCTDSDTILITVSSSTPYLTNLPFTDLTVECGGLLPSETPTFADDCDSSLTVVSDTIITNLACGYVQQITWTATNDDGNSATFVQTLTVEDTTPPTMSASHPFFGPILNGDTLLADCSQVPSLNAMAFSSFDLCSAVTVAFSEKIVDGDCDVDGFLELRDCGWTVLDSCGNRDSLFFVVIITDNLPPVLSPAPPNLTVDCDAVPLPVILSATDNCDSTLTVYVDETLTADSGGCVSQILRTWSVEDDCGNLTIATQIITVTDTQDPVLVGVPADLNWTCETPLPGPPVVTATDNCDSNVPVSFSQSLTGGSGGGCFTIARTWTATDDCGNTVSASQTIDISDLTAPVLAGVPADESLSCDLPLPTPAFVTATDSCDADVPVTFNQNTTGDPATGCYTITRTWSATDDCGNAVSASQTITITDTTPPVIAGVPAGVTQSCETPLPGAPLLTATDLCDANVPVTFSQSTMGNPATGCYVITRTWSATDDCGNTATASQTITVQDNVPPTIASAPADTTFSCLANMPTAPILTATDNCDSNVPVVLSETTLGNPAGCNFQITRSWIATDDCGNTSVEVQVITINDTTPPVIAAAPANTTIACGSPVPAAPTLTATDNCDTSVTVSWSEIYIGDPTSGCYLIERTWTATDDCGNTATSTQAISVNDVTPPNFVGLPVGGNADCDSIPGDNVTATDNCDANVTVTISDQITSGGGSCVTQIVRTWTASDDCGNIRIASRTYNVVNTDAPIITVVHPMMLGLSDGDVLWLECQQMVSLTANDAAASADCCGEATIIFQEFVSPGNCQADGYLQVMHCGWIATDCCGNVDSLFFTVYVTDNTPPQFFGVPASEILPVGSPLPPAPVVYATDNCDFSVPLSYNSVTTGPADNQLTTRTWTSSDDCGNIATATQTILMTDDNTAPLIANVPPDITLEYPADIEPPLGNNVTATDNMDNNVTVVFEEEVQGGQCCYVVLRTWTATDDFGNSTTETQTITVIDSEAPVISGTIVNVSAVCSAGNVPLPQLTASDNCTANLVLEFQADTVQTTCGFQVLRNWSVVDECGNVALATQTITVQDDEAPTFDLADQPTLELFTSNGAQASAGVSLSVGDEISPDQPWTIAGKTMPAFTGVATDNCSAPDGIVFKVAEIGNVGSGCGETFTVAFAVLDACGNAAQQLFTVTATVTDDVAPAFGSVPQNGTANCQFVPPPPAMTATDASGGNVTIDFNEVQNGGCPRTFVRTWTATDACGNSATVSQTITVTDNAAPVIANVPAHTMAVCGSLPPVPVNVTASDDCTANVPVVFSQTTSGSGCTYTVTRTWTATDNCGNSAVKQQYIWVADNQAPVITTGPPADLTLNCDSNLPPVASLTVSDNCDASPDVDFVETIVPGNGCDYSVLRTWTVSDACGNSTSASQTIHVTDTTVPLLANIPADLTVNCADIPAPPAVLASDNCDANVAIEFKQTQTGGCPYSILRTWTATDACGNESSATQVITVIDTQAPVLSAGPANISVHCGAEVPAAATLTATDGCSPAVPVTMQETVNGSGCNYTLTRTWTASDACGNASNFSQTIEVGDTEAPVIAAAPANLTVGCGEVPAPVALTATDNCDSNVSIDFDETTTATPCGENLLRTWTATDDCGNTTSVSQLISVTDGEAPTAVEPADLTVGCGELPAAAAPAFADNCDSDLAIDFTETTTATPCGEEVLRTWTATDHCGNSTTVDQLITVTDNVAPVLAFSHPMLAGLADGDTLTVDCSNGFTFSKTDVLATDNCSSAAVEVTSGEVDFGDCQVDGYLIASAFHWLATDACGNVATLTLHVQVVDETAPVFINFPPDVVVNCGQTPPDFAEPEVQDDCGNVALDLVVDAVPTAYGYDLSCTWTATDLCGNAASDTQIFEFYNIGAAQLQGIPADLSVNLGNGESVPAPASVTAIDNCSGDLLAVFYEENTTQTNGCNSVIERTWTATGLNGIPVSETQSITVTDYLQLSASLGADTCNASNGAAHLFPADADYVWSDGGTGAVRNDLAAGGYTVTATNANGCSATIDLTVAAYCSCEMAVIEKVKFNTTDCGESTGKAVIHLIQNEADYTYTWVPDLGVPSITGHARTQLPAGHYEVFISRTGVADCIVKVGVDIDDECPDCGPIFGVLETSLSPNPPAGGPTEVCLPVPFDLAFDYEILLDGQPYLGTVQPCDQRPVKTYDYSTVDGAGLSGPYSVSWLHDGTTFYTLVENTSELATVMKFVNPQGQWFNDASGQRLVTVNTGGNYGKLTIRHSETNQSVEINPVANLSDVGTSLTIPQGPHTVTYTSLITGCEDSLAVSLVPTEGEVAEQISSGGNGAQVLAGTENREAAQAAGLVIYNGFSPNGDGVNDFFRIDGLAQFPLHELSIFSSAGHLVFKTRHYQNDWGGSWSQNNLPDGTYYYVLEDGNGKRYTGFVQIRR